MPEFQRGVALAYCDPPGPLDKGQKTFYAVSPIPDDWTDKQVESFLREYNSRSIQNLTIHEAMPGHYLQLTHSNRYDSRAARGARLRAVHRRMGGVHGARDGGAGLPGWRPADAPHPAQVVSAHDCRTRSWIRACTSTACRAKCAMHLMTHDTFQEEREASGKWVRAQLSSAQLPTYFVGVQEHLALREEAKQRWGAQLLTEALSRQGAVLRLAAGALCARADLRSADRAMTQWQGLTTACECGSASARRCRSRAPSRWSSQRFAQANSSARMPRPAGITMKAGPGSTIIATPMHRTVNPTTAITIRLHPPERQSHFRPSRRV